MDQQPLMYSISFERKKRERKTNEKIFILELLYFFISQYEIKWIFADRASSTYTDIGHELRAHQVSVPCRRIDGVRRGVLLRRFISANHTGDINIPISQQ